MERRSEGVKSIYAVFKKNGWQRELNPLEIFYDLTEASNFAWKLRQSDNNQSSNTEWRVYERTATDWEILKS
jgi:hypothetical protein